MIHIDDVDEVTRELVEYKYSLNNPNLKDIAFIHTRIESLHAIKNIYINKVKEYLLKGESINKITVFEAEYNRINHKEIYDFLYNAKDHSISPLLTSYILFHHNVSNTGFSCTIEKDDFKCIFKIEGIYSSFEIKKQYTFPSIDTVLKM